ncbi:putative reverse transcriptase domain-containing protein [Tanacetum coccineum]
MPHLQPYHLAKLLTSFRRRMKRTLRRILLTILPMEEIILDNESSDDDNNDDDVEKDKDDEEEEEHKLQPTLLLYLQMNLSPQAENTEAFETDKSASTPPTSSHHIILSFETKSHAKYMEKKGFPIFLAHVTAKEVEDKSEVKRLEDVPIVQDFPEVFPEDFPGLPPTRQVEFQIEFGMNEQEHKEHLKQILELLKKEELYAKFSKCEFWIPKLQFLGHVIDSEGIHVDPAKIESIEDWTSPKSSTEIRQFLGLARYYRRFIEGFSKIAKPMTKLAQKKVKFEWGDKQEAAFQLLKQKLCSAPILALPKGSEDFIAYCDALKKGLGAVLMQREKWCSLSRSGDIIYMELSERVASDSIRDSLDHGEAKCVAGCFEQERTRTTLRVRAMIVLKEGGRRHGIPVSIICDRDPRFPINLYGGQLRNGLFGLQFGYVYCDITNDGQSGEINKTHLRTALYGQMTFTVCWTEVGEAQILGPELIQETTEKIIQIKQRMQAARNRQKSYADLKRKPMEFQIGDKVMLKVSPWKGVVRFGKRGKLNPRYVGPFKVIERVGKVAYKLELPEELSRVS